MIKLLFENENKLILSCTPCVPLYSKIKFPVKPEGAVGFDGYGTTPLSKDNLPSGVKFTIEFKEIDDPLFTLLYHKLLTDYLNADDDIVVSKSTTTKKSKVLDQVSVDKINVQYEELKNKCDKLLADCKDIGLNIYEFSYPSKPDNSKFYEVVDEKIPQIIDILCHDSTRCYKELNTAGLLSKYFSSI